MISLPDLVQQGQSSLWLLMPAGAILGALHGLEPGHSKTMMAAFIVAVRGTVGQAILLGLSATFSHTAVVWIVAVLGLTLGRRFDNEGTEAWLQLAAAGLMLLISLGTAYYTWRELRIMKRAMGSCGHDHSHDHHDHSHEHHDHAHHHASEEQGPSGLVIGADGWQDAHERKHAEDIRNRFAGRTATTAQIILFGLTGGLIPCPAAVTVLLMCLQMKRLSLGFMLVLSFSIGLAVTMVAAGTIAAVSANHVRRRWPGFENFARRAPYASAALIAVIGLISGWHALRTLGYFS